MPATFDTTGGACLASKPGLNYRPICVIQHGRLITNSPIALREPMRFNRKTSAEFSVVETAVLRALGVDQFDFQRTGERETVVPARVLEQQRREAVERKRLTAAAGPS